MKIVLQALASAVAGILCLGLALFVPAGTVRYWPGWGFIAVFTACSVASGAYLAMRRPRRSPAG